MSNRTRPYAYTFRVTENERKIIDEKIKSSGLTMTAFIIKAITNKPIVVFANSGEILNELKRQGKLKFNSPFLCMRQRKLLEID